MSELALEFCEDYVSGPIGQKVRFLWGDEGLHWSCLGWKGEEKLRWMARRAAETCENAGNRELTVLEVGTHRGVSSAILAVAGFRVITFDVMEYPFQEEIWEGLGVRDKIDARLCRGNTDLDLQASRLNFDIAFIDGNHKYDSVARNFYSLKRCGRVIFHDYEPVRHMERTVRFVNNLQDGTTVKCVPFALWLSPEASGIPVGLEEVRP